MIRKLSFFILFIAVSFFTFSQKQLTLEDLWQKYILYARPPQGLKSMNDGEHYSVNESEAIAKYNFLKGEKIAEIFSLKDLPADAGIKSIDDYELSKDENLILFSTNEEAIYRHSSRSEYYVWNIKNKKLTSVSKNGKQQLASFSEDGKKVAFVRDNNIYVTNIDDAKETQITTDGKPNFIINGAPDWVYEEEFSFSKGYEWSPDGTKIAFMKLNETEVKEFDITAYKSLYPEKSRYKYPKAGEKNSDISIHVFDMNSGKIQKMDIGSEKDIYIPRIRWTVDPNILCLTRLNRLQNKMELLLCNAANGESKVILTETHKYYVEVKGNDLIHFTTDGKSMILNSEKDGFNHLYHYDVNGNLMRQITQGNWDIDAFIGYDEKKKILYYISSEASPLMRDVYAISIDGKKKKKISQKAGTNKAVFSENFKYMINTWSDSDAPPVISVNDTEGKELRVIEDNSHIRDLIKDFGFTQREFLKIKNSSGTELNAWMIKPPAFDASKKYPVLMYLYGGPGSQEVKRGWDYMDCWFHLLAQKGYIVACVDNRGTGARGTEFKKMTYGQLGKFETEDQIDANKYLASLPYVDGSRIGIWGWSYGGYMSTLCLAKGADVFKMAIAVAPVTNWRYYDSIYTERYMGLPQDNAAGYDDNSPINHVDKIKGNYLLVHGDADDNVHAQNTYMLIDKLVAANKQFDLMVYPNNNHGIYSGKNTRYHLFSKLTNFILEKL
ncbi:MAG: peptidase S9 [Bacteroidetes bacterium RIFOXYA12_FULL_35_11]|nr:MAG: peptidase S9 [Bacteroidetes bacterium GWF2_35_48]OFY80588.1 MAG: peptidase S9 [Bacteroidetes bacterium RIFOXYA12_FULL_35_11]OFY92690.1 MAG: peptidase S9 [Bacteroidetes bacterium RIFOXYB2_FULL_35_7]HBX50035.1 S9 family peptidase [Bacteroidales bacterium]